MYDSNISYVAPQLLDLDCECMMDFATQKGIRISSVESFNKKSEPLGPNEKTKKNERLMNGLQSPFFGSDFSEEDAFRERYSCRCHKYIGKAYEGYVCESCGTTVQYSDIDLTKFGWIIIDHFTVISPIFAAKLSDILGNYDGDKYLTKILDISYTEDGEPEFSDKELEDLKKYPYLHKGMIWLYEHLDEVLDSMEKKKPTKVPLINQLRRYRDRIFTHSIPVYSSLLRTELPGEKGGKDFRLKINTTYRAIIRLTNSINSHSPKDFDQKVYNSINRQLAAIQRELDIIFTETYKELTSKNGIIVSKVMGGRHNFSARNIIVPSTGILHTDEVGIGYLTFLELFRYEIINFYAKLQGCTIAEAATVVKKGTNHFNSTIYSIMEYMVSDPECKKNLWVLVSRNPCKFITARLHGNM